jgi:hypothetical protein
VVLLTLSKARGDRDPPSRRVSRSLAGEISSFTAGCAHESGRQMRAISTLAGNVAHGVCVKGERPSRRLPWDVVRRERRSGAKRNRHRSYSIATISFYFELRDRDDTGPSRRPARRRGARVIAHARPRPPRQPRRVHRRRLQLPDKKREPPQPARTPRVSNSGLKKSLDRGALAASHLQKTTRAATARAVSCPRRGAPMRRSLLPRHCLASPRAKMLAT